MVETKKLASLSELSGFKQGYFDTATAPLDGMWHFGFVPMSDHYGFYLDGTLIGFCCKNAEGYLLQFYVEPKEQSHAQKLFNVIVNQENEVIGETKGAFVSTAETSYLSYCLDNSSEFKVNALMYQYGANQFTQQHEKIEMQLCKTSQLSDFVTFAVQNIGVPKMWVTGYYQKLCERQELFGYWRDGQIIAAGECRLFEKYQTGYADLGMVVAQSERGRGIAKQVLCFLIKHSISNGLQPMCSTERDNVSAQQAISQVGFISSNRIVQFEFNLAE